MAIFHTPHAFDAPVSRFYRIVASTDGRIDILQQHSPRYAYHLASMSVAQSTLAARAKSD